MKKPTAKKATAKKATAKKTTAKKTTAKKTTAKKTTVKTAAPKKAAAKKTTVKKTTVKKAASKKATAKKTTSKRAPLSTSASGTGAPPMTPPVPFAKGAPTPPPPTKQARKVHPPPPLRPGQGAFARGHKRPGAPAGGKPPRPTMPWPTGTSTAGLRVANEGVLPPKPVTPPPPPPKRRIKDSRPPGKITATSVSNEGIDITLEGGRRLLMPFTVFDVPDISRIEVTPNGFALVIFLRSGDHLEYSLLRIQELSRTFEERHTPEE